jgi:hypothetical protein
MTFCGVTDRRGGIRAGETALWRSMSSEIWPGALRIALKENLLRFPQFIGLRRVAATASFSNGL